MVCWPPLPLLLATVITEIEMKMHILPEINELEVQPVVPAMSACVSKILRNAIYQLFHLDKYTSRFYSESFRYYRTYV